MTKDDICDRLRRLPHKRGVPRLTTISITPYADQPLQPDLSCTRNPTAWRNFVFLENTGEVWIIDGLSDQGYGEVIVYARVGRAKTGDIESTHVPTFNDRLNAVDHKQRWYLGTRLSDGYDRHASSTTKIKFQNVIGALLPISTVYADVRSHSLWPKRTSSTLIADGNLANGTMVVVSKVMEWLRFTVNRYIQEHYPELHRTKLQQFFASRRRQQLGGTTGVEGTLGSHCGARQ